MKFLQITLLFFFVSMTPIFAQEIDDYEQSNAGNGQRNMSYGKNTLEISIGSPRFAAHAMNREEPYGGCFWKSLFYHHAYPSKEYTSVCRALSPTINASYFRSLAWWIQLGPVCSYAFYKEDFNDTEYDVYAFTLKTQMLTVIPTVRFNFRHRKNFGLYSSAGFGFKVVRDKNLNYLYSYEPNVVTKFKSTAQVTLIGLRVGSKVYGFGELGLGPKGFFSGGVGVRL